MVKGDNPFGEVRASCLHRQFQTGRSLVTSGAWWLVVFPGAAVFITVTVFNLVGDGLRDAMDPRLRV